MTTQLVRAIELKRLHLAQAVAMAANGEITDAKTRGHLASFWRQARDGSQSS